MDEGTRFCNKCGEKVGNDNISQQNTTSFVQQNYEQSILSFETLDSSAAWAKNQMLSLYHDNMKLFGTEGHVLFDIKYTDIANVESSFMMSTVTVNLKTGVPYKIFLKSPPLGKVSAKQVAKHIMEFMAGQQGQNQHQNIQQPYRVPTVPAQHLPQQADFNNPNQVSLNMAAGTVSSRLTMIKILWFVQAGLSLFIAFVTFIVYIPDWIAYGPFCCSQEITGLFLTLLFVFSGVAALLLGFSFGKFQAKIRYSHACILYEYDSSGKHIAILVFAIFFGGLFGFIAAILNVVNRNFAISNRHQFM
jgi:hypothetical protein